MSGYRDLALFRKIRLHGLRGMWILLLILSFRIEDRQTRRAQAEYDHAFQLFLHGQLVQSQQEATAAADRYEAKGSAWAVKFRRLEVKCLIYRDMNREAEKISASYLPAPGDSEGQIWKLLNEGYFASNRQDYATAEQKLALAGSLCRKSSFLVCGDVLQVQGEIAWGHGQNGRAWDYLLQALSFAQRHNDRWMEAEVEGTLGVVSFSHQRLDESVDWLGSAYRHQAELGAGSQALNVALDLGLAYSMLGDRDKAYELVSEGEKLAAGSGSAGAEVEVLLFWGDFYQGEGEPERAVPYFRKALELYRSNGFDLHLSDCIGLLAEAELDLGDVANATDHFHQALGVVPGKHTYTPSDRLFLGRLAAANRKFKQAVLLLHPIVSGPKFKKTVRMRAGLELARVYEGQGRDREAEQMYRTALAIFEATRTEVAHQESALSMAAIAKPLNQGYIDLLVREGRVEDALAVADSSRAQALAQGLGVGTEKFSIRRAGWNPRQIAKKADATILFYWLGKQHSYMWAIDEHRIALKRLPGAAEITARVDRYRKALEEKQDPLQENNLCRQDGRDLYTLLALPAAQRIKPNGRVMILSDGALSRLNFETLLAPGPPPSPAKTSRQRTPTGQAGNKRGPLPQSGPRHREGNAHYWIEDAVLASAPSLSMLAAAKPDSGAQGKLLLVGDAVSPSPEYPALALAGMEMNLVQRHFGGDRRTVLSGGHATPAAYLGSSPAQYAYLHFVTHGTASSTAPLESAIILSRDGGGATPYQQGPFKLYARDIVQHPVDARLVTISACYGSGARTYTGEGLVGLAWAFLRAGAHNVIGALWEVSDEATPRLMDGLYTGLDAGLDPAAALRKSKLALLHSKFSYRAPFFWAGFQVYTGH
jgi:tetratricopeptide (TPR) repeat protein